MAIEFIQFSNATATDGAIVAADLIDFAGGATEVSVQMVKLGYGTDSVFNQIATGQGIPVATGPVYQIQQMATATSPVSVGTWTATGQLLTSPLASATQPVSVGTWTATGALNLATTATLAVVVTDVIPGTSTDNLGKAIDTVAGATDTGVAMLAKHKEDHVHLITADGDYDVLEINSLGALAVSGEQHHIFDEMDVTTDWAALGNDTLNLATTTIHALGTAALTFDKVDGLANTVFGAIDKTIASVDIGAVSPHDIIQTVCYLSNVATVDYAFVRLGTNNANYNEWRIPGEALTSDEMEVLAFVVGDTSHPGSTGAGWDPSAITYIVVGIAFADEADELSGIIFDELSYHTNQHTSASIQSEVTSSVNSSNVNLQKVGGTVVDRGAGNVSNGSQRIVIASDDVLMATVATGIESLASVVIADDDPFPGASPLVPVGYFFNDVTPNVVDEGDIGAGRMSSLREIYTQIRDAAGNERGVNVTSLNALTVDGSTATQPVTVQNTATVAITGTVSIDAATGSIAVIQGTATELNAEIGGRWAHDATSTGNPVYIGGIAQTSRPTAVAAGDVVEGWFDPHGRQIVMPICVRGDVLDNQFTVSATSIATMATAGAAGVFHDLIWMTMMNNATTEAQIRIRSTSTATKWQQINLAPDGGGISFTPPRPAVQAAAAGTWDVQLSSSIVGQVDVSAEFMRTT